MSSLMKRVSSNYFFMARVPHYLGSYTTGYKKRKSKDFLFWVPSGIRTHDIQNHNLTL